MPGRLSLIQETGSGIRGGLRGVLVLAISLALIFGLTTGCQKKDQKPVKQAAVNVKV